MNRINLLGQIRQANVLLIILYHISSTAWEFFLWTRQLHLPCLLIFQNIHYLFILPKYLLFLQLCGIIQY